MKKYFKKSWNVWLPFLLLAGASVFFICFYSYQFGLIEQTKLFLYTSDYFDSLFFQKGGLMKYLASFLIQFYYLRWVGALVAVLSLLCSWILTRGVLDLFAVDRTRTSWIALVAPALLWVSFTFLAFPLDKALSFLAALGSVLVYDRVGNLWGHRVIGLLTAIVWWFLIGEAAFLTALLFLYREWKRGINRENIWYPVVLLILFAVCPFVYRQTSVIVSVPGIFGIEDSLTGYILYYFALYLYLIVSVLLVSSRRRSFLVPECSLVVAVTLGYVACFKTADFRTENLSKMDWFVRHGHWDAAVAEIDRMQRINPHILSYYFLALAETNRMGDCLLEKGVPLISSLLPGIAPNYMAFTTLSEVYWANGNLRGTQLCDYEAMAMLDAGLNGRHLKRASEVHILFGETELAERYLRILSKTTFYGRWAKEQLALMHADPTMAMVPWVHEKRAFVPSESFQLNVRSPYLDIFKLAVLQPYNRVANEYALSCLLLEKDMAQFKEVFDRYWNAGPDGCRIPAIFQQANLIYEYVNRIPESKRLQYDYDRQVLNLFNEYKKIHETGSARTFGRASFSPGFLKSYFYYYDFTNTVDK